MSPDESPMSLRYGRLLLTGAAGNLGRVLRPRLARHCKVLRLSDRCPMDAAGPHEEACIADLADVAAVDGLVTGVDAIAHFGGIATEQAWAPILSSNIIGMLNLYEAGRRHRVKRIVFASSNHVTGFYRRDQVIDCRDPVRPDGFYGLSKAFGENLAQFYWDRFGLETVSMRIGSPAKEPKDRRMLCTWLSFDDLERLVVSALFAPDVGHSIVYGMSDNRTVWWDNRRARHIGFRPLDSSEPFRAAVEASQPAPEAEDPAELHQGGTYVTLGPFED